jgi:hypothetical protein
VEGSCPLKSDSVNSLASHDTLFMVCDTEVWVEVGQLVKHSLWPNAWTTIIDWRRAALHGGVPSLPLSDVPPKWINKEICLNVRCSPTGAPAKCFRIQITGERCISMPLEHCERRPTFMCGCCVPFWCCRKAFPNTYPDIVSGWHHGARR